MYASQICSMHIFVCVCVCARAWQSHEEFLSRLVYVYACKQVQGKLQDKLLENEVFSNLETLYADGKAMKETLEEAQGLVEETRDSVKTFKKSARALKKEAFGGGDGEEGERWRGRGRGGTQ